MTRLNWERRSPTAYGQPINPLCGGCGLPVLPSQRWKRSRGHRDVWHKRCAMGVTALRTAPPDDSKGVCARCGRRITDPTAAWRVTGGAEHKICPP